MTYLWLTCTTSKSNPKMVSNKDVSWHTCDLPIRLQSQIHRGFLIQVSHDIPLTYLYDFNLKSTEGFWSRCHTTYLWLTCTSLISNPQRVFNTDVSWHICDLPVRLQSQIHRGFSIQMSHDIPVTYLYVFNLKSTEGFLIQMSHDIPVTYLYDFNLKSTEGF